MTPDRQDELVEAQTPSESRKQLRTALRRSEILRVAAELFSEIGYEQATIEQIAERLGLSKAALYYYVDSKESLLVQILTQAMTSLEAEVQAAIEGVAKADDALRALIATHIQRVCSQPRGEAVAFHLVNKSLVRDNVDLLAANRRYRRTVVNLIKKGVQQGLLVTPDPNLSALALIGAINSVELWYSPEGEFTSSDIANYYSEVFIQGMSTGRRRPKPIR